MSGNWHGPRGRPPWVPEDAEWPPQGGMGPPWRSHPRRFMWRIGAVLALFPLLLFFAFALIFWLAAAALGAIDIPRSGFVWVIPLGILAVVFGFASILRMARALRGTAGPVTELLAAA